MHTHPQAHLLIHLCCVWTVKFEKCISLW